MSAQHGTRHRYIDGCRCDDCKAANRDYQRDLRWRHANGEAGQRATVVSLPAAQEPVVSGPGPVERAVTSEIGGLTQADMRPALVEPSRWPKFWTTPGRCHSSPRPRASWPTSSTARTRVRRLVGVA
jgi:hypothetical protein